MTGRPQPFGIRLRRSILALSVLCTPWLLGGCAGPQTAQLDPGLSRAAPGTINAYIHEASEKFNMPEQWIRAVMQQESGGRTHVNGKPIVSNKGAMGLMQVMPGTWSYLRRAYSLGDDPFDPHDNIIAGTAYLREMFDLYGSPGFLAAYNAGPGRYEYSLKTSRPLPGETRHYIAVIEPRLAGIRPEGPSPTSPMVTVASRDAPAHSAFDGDTTLPPGPIPTPQLIVAELPPAPVSAPAPAPVPVSVSMSAPRALPAAEPVRATVVAKPAAPAPVVTARADDRDDDSAGAPPLPGHRPGHGGTTATDQQAQRSVALADRHNGLPPGWYVPVAYTR